MSNLGILSNNVAMKERFIKRNPRSDMYRNQEARSEIPSSQMLNASDMRRGAAGAEREREATVPAFAAAASSAAPAASPTSSAPQPAPRRANKELSWPRAAPRDPAMDAYWAFGLARRAPLYIDIPSCAAAPETLRRYAKRPEDFALARARSRQWYLLYFPMEEIVVAEEHRQYFMRARTIDAVTGQPGWVLMKVYERYGNDEERTFKKFTIYPH
tara:strand:- start:160 stop:804 length:645 start_codon:yes stop_codon:yes gene_type:complete